MSKETYFTVVFEGNVAKLGFNPLQCNSTAFGTVDTVGRGNVFDERDYLAARIDELEAALNGAMEKIKLYREKYGCEYLGGMPMMILDQKARAALGEKQP